VAIILLFHLVNAQYPACQVSYNGKSFDFSPLRSQDDYIVSTQNGTVWINMCGTLTNADIIEQFPSSSAAVQDYTQNYLSLGNASTLSWTTATVNNVFAIVANYTGGTNNLAYSIVFTCDQFAINDGKGQPTIDQISNNQYIFQWKTSFACTAGPGDCFANYNQYTIDLTPLRGNTDYKVLGNSATYFVNICGPLAANSVCTNVSETVGCLVQGPDQITIGISDASSIYYDPQMSGVVAQYFGGTEGRRMIYQLVCNNTAGTGSPVFINENPSRTYNFYWQNNVTCIQTK